MNDGDEGNRIIHCNSNRIGFLNQSGSWGAWLDDGNNWYAAGALYAPIFYDSENTAFYVDPSGASNIRNLYVGDAGGSWSDPGGWGTQVRFANGPHVRFVLHARTPGIEAGMYVHTPGEVYIGSYTGHNVSMMWGGSRRMFITNGYIYTDVYLEAAGSLRAPIFYDSNDTGYYLDPNSTSNLYFIQMPHLGNGSPNIRVNNGGAENWNAINIGGSTQFGIGFSGSSRSWSGRNSLAIHVGASESFRVHSDGWDSLFEVWGSSGYVRTKGSLEVGGDVYLGTRGSWMTTLLDAKQNASSAINTGNIGSQSVSYASNSGAVSGIGVSTLRGLIGYNSTSFYVNGDANTYYPVLISLGGQFGMNRYSISRGYSDPAPWDPIGTGSHRGGLTLTFDASSDIAWGGNDKSWRIIQFAESYTNMVAGMALPVTGGILVWLRGGGAYYSLQGPNGVNHSATVYLDGYSAANGAFYERRTSLSNVDSEIRSKWPIRGFGDGDIYVNNSAVIHAGNIGSQSVNYASSSGSTGNADTVDGYHATFSGNANTIPVRNASGYLEPNNWIQLNGIYGLYAPTNNAHLRPNDSSYGSWQMTGSRNGWQGIEFNSGSNGNVSLMVATDSNTVGFHNNSYGWQIRWANGTMYIAKNSYGGNEATVIDSSSIGSQTVARAGRANGNFYIDDNYGNTVVGVYASTRLQGVWAMGDAYKLAADGSGAANHYGIAWSHPNHGGTAARLTNHGMLIQAAGNTWTAISDSIWCIGDITAFSDARVKTNIEVIDNPLERLSKVRGVTFNRTDLEHKDKRYAGVIAQEMREALPEVVTEDGNGELSVSYGNTVSLLIESIKAQQVQIEELKAEVKKLRGE
jgi:hypothetical protein